MNTRMRTIGLLLTVALAACSGGGGSGPPKTGPVIGSGPSPQPAPPQTPPSLFTYRPCTDYDLTSPSQALPALPGGLWHGQVTNETTRQSEPFDLAVTEDGRFWFFIDNDEFIGTLHTDGASYSGSGVAYSGGLTWSDGSLLSDAFVDGVIAERDRLAGTWALQSGDTGCNEAFYDAALYEQPVTLQQLAGTWATTDGWGLYLITLEIEEDGSFVFYDPWDCSDSGRGRIALIDDRYNLLEVQDMVPDCPVSATPYTGLLYAGSLTGDATGLVPSSVVLAISNGDFSLRLPLYR